MRQAMHVAYEKARRCFGNDGQTIVEFSLIIMLLLTLLFGITEFGRAWYYTNVMTNGVRAGARYASRMPSLDTTKVHDYTVSQIGSLPGGSPTVTVSVADDNGKSGLNKGDSVTVKASYGFEAFSGSIIPALDGTTAITRSATMYYELN